MNSLMPFTRSGILNAVNTSATLPLFPTAGAAMIYAPDYNPSILNLSGSPASYYDDVYTIQDLSGNGRHGTWASGQKPIYLQHTGRNYIWMAGVPGTAGSPGGCSLAYHASMVLDEFTFEIEVALEDWSPALTQLVACRFASGTAAGWLLYLDVAGTLTFQWFVPGGTTAISTANLSGFAARQKAWIRVHYTRNTGAGQYAVVFAHSLDGVTWTQLGTTLTGTSTAAIANTSTPPLRVASGWAGPGMALQGRLYSFSLRSGSPTGTKIADWDASLAVHLSNSSKERIQGLVFTHQASSDTACLRVMVGKGTLWVNGSRMTIANPVGVSTADYITAQLSSSMLTGGSAISFSTTSTTASTIPYGIYNTAASVFSSNNAGALTATHSIAYQRGMFIGRQVGAVGYFNVNGTVTAPAPSASSTSNTLNQMFARGTADFSSAAFGRVGHWMGASLPTPLEVENFLEGHEVQLDGFQGLFILQSLYADQIDVELDGFQGLGIFQTSLAGEPNIEGLNGLVIVQTQYPEDVNIEGLNGLVIVQTAYP